MSTVESKIVVQSETTAQRYAKVATVSNPKFSAILTLLDIITPNFKSIVKDGSDRLNALPTTRLALGQ